MPTRESEPFDIAKLNEDLTRILAVLQDERPEKLRLVELTLLESLTLDVREASRAHIERLKAEEDNRRRNLERRELEMRLNFQGGGF